MRSRPGSALIRCVLVLAVGLIAVNLLALAVRYSALTAMSLGVVAYRRLTRWETSDAYGSARASRIVDLYERSMLDDEGLIMGSCGYLDPPTRAEGLRALFSPSLPSTLAVRLFLAAFFSPRWMEP